MALSSPVKNTWKQGATILCLALAIPGGALGAEPPQALMAEAAAATQALGSEVVKENFSFTIQRMYPRWKTQAAKRMGGMDKLVEILAEVPKEMKRNGITILSFEVGQPASVFEVNQVIAKTNDGEVLRAFTEWLVFVPTTTKYLVIEKETGRKRHLMTTGFQVAVKKKDAELKPGDPRGWFFIDGSSLSIETLRRMFPTLPATKEAMQLPEVGRLKEYNK
jgi:hypothetical protein